MKISIQELKKITEELFSYLEKEDIHTVEFDYDYYWHISDEQLFSIDTEPKDNTIGQLTEDYKEILLDSQNGAIGGHTFFHLAPLFRYLSKKVV